jgi:hypothetical protein
MKEGEFQSTVNQDLLEHAAEADSPHLIETLDAAVCEIKK